MRRRRLCSNCSNGSWREAGGGQSSGIPQTRTFAPQTHRLWVQDTATPRPSSPLATHFQTGCPAKPLPDTLLPQTPGAA
eukprot:13645857-Alexandrium_andersonii.AAC.1